MTILLNGCSSSPTIDALNRAATEQDRLPAGVTLQPENEIPAGSVRFLAEDNAVRYFGAKSADGKRACVAAVPEGSSASSWIAGCADLRDDREIVHVSGKGIREVVDVNRLLASGWKPIHKNIVISPS
ncbi:hypothetical protein [Arthrobacter sp. NPDC057259]|uniref:hypothetical protein n=1 Tax=Arthrobacter sp. NPDC057259 TaxID=3346073 RepID=UPI00362BEE08